jgi:hypothetical protein
MSVRYKLFLLRQAASKHGRFQRGASALGEQESKKLAQYRDALTVFDQMNFGCFREYLMVIRDDVSIV